MLLIMFAFVFVSACTVTTSSALRKAAPPSLGAAQAAKKGEWEWSGRAPPRLSCAQVAPKAKLNTKDDIAEAGL